MRRFDVNALAFVACAGWVRGRLVRCSVIMALMRFVLSRLIVSCMGIVCRATTEQEKS
jgi:hypothetical protein